MEKTTPLIIVFYLDSDLMTRQEIIKPFVESVNQMLHHKNANALAFFLPTNGEERVECINPVMLEKADMDKINTLLDDIRKNFSVGVDLGPADKILEKKLCDCGNNPDGECKCD